MEIREFAERVCAGVAEKLGQEYDVCVREVPKNNGVSLQGIAIGKKEEKVMPILYLEDLWGEYQEGRELEGIISEVLDRYVDSLSMELPDAERYNDFEKIKSGICFRLFGRENNEEFLKGVPYMEFLDMAVCFYYADEANQEGLNKLLTVNNALMERWGTDIDELFRLASENTPRIFPGECRPLEQLITKIMWPDMGGSEEELSSSLFEGSPMLVLCNDKRQYGAACILYPGVLEAVAENEKNGFYIIPSSVHEIILVRDTGEGTADRLKDMIHQVNREVVEPEDVLTDSLYYYDAVEKKVKTL